MLTVLMVIILACCVIAWCRRNTNNNEPPAINGYFPLIGHYHVLFAADNIQYWIYFKETVYESLQVGGVVRYFIGPKTVYHVSDPDDFTQIANTCLEKDHFYGFAKPWLGDGLVTSNVSTWSDHRKMLDSAFHRSLLDGFLDILNKQARRLVTDLELEVGRGPFDHYVYTRRNALETSCLTIFGVDSDKSYNKYIDAMDQMFVILEQRFHRPWLYLNFMYSWSTLKRKQDKCLKIIHEYSSTVMKKKKEEYIENRRNKNNENGTNGPKLKSFLELLLDKGAFNDQEIKDHVNTLMFGGHDTIASVLMTTMLLVGSSTNVQNKVFEELDNIFNNDDRDVTMKDLSQMTYLEAVIKESLRIYPVIPVVTRHLDRDVKLKNCTLSKGEACFLSIYGTNRHPVWGPDAERFNPERWMDPARLPKYTALAGFGVGRRTCIGKSYSLMCLKTTLAHVFRRYRVSGNHNMMLSKMDVMTRPVMGHHVSIEMRK